MLSQEVVENPLLEEVESEEQQQTDAAAQVEKADPDPEPTTETQDTWDDADYAYFFGDYLDDGYRPRVPREVKELPPIENTLSTVSTLSDHLTWQLTACTDDHARGEIGTAIIGNLDEDGYLVASLEEIAAMGGWPEAEIERVVSLVQGFDPVGVAARDLQECLLLQVHHLGLDNTPSDVIIREHLHLLQNHQVLELARRLAMSIDEVKDHIEIIRHLDPTPGNRQNPSPSQYVIPDVYVTKVEGQYVAALNEEGLPQLRISPVYRRMLDKNSHTSSETRSYVRDKFRSGRPAG